MKVFSAFFAGLLCLAFLISCQSLSEKGVGGVEDANSIDFDYETFAKEKKAWELSKIENYQYTIVSYGFMYYDSSILVENGHYKEQKTNTAKDPYMEEIGYYLTIDEIYQKIEELYKTYRSSGRNENTVYLTKINIDYDRQIHIPLKIKYDYYFPPGLAVDGNYYYEIKDFKNGPLR